MEATFFVRVNGYVKHVRSFIICLLNAVAMVDILGKDENFSTELAKFTLAYLRGDTNVLVDTEALGVLAFRMMARWTDDSEDVLDLAGEYSSACLNCATSSQSGTVRRRR